MVSRRGFLRGMGSTVSVMAIAAKLNFTAPAETSFGLAQVKAEGASIAYDEVRDKYTAALAKSMRQTIDKQAANVLNRAFTHQTYSTQHVLTGRPLGYTIEADDTEDILYGIPDSEVSMWDRFKLSFRRAA